MMFPSQAVREVKENYSDNSCTTILMFSDGFNEDELKATKTSAKKHNPNVNFVEINSKQDILDYINEDTKSCSQIETVKFFAHGLPSTFDFGLDGPNRESQMFKKEDVGKIEDGEFTNNPNIYSYACRTGNADQNLIRGEIGYGDDWEKYVKPQESLAQEFANEHNATIHAPIRKTLYSSTWNDHGDKEYAKNAFSIEDGSIHEPEDFATKIFTNGWDGFKALGGDTLKGRWDEARWHDEGAYGAPTVGASPVGIPSDMYIFERGKSPRAEGDDNSYGDIE